MNRAELAEAVYRWFKLNSAFNSSEIWRSIAQTDDDSLYEFYLEHVFEEKCGEED